MVGRRSASGHVNRLALENRWSNMVIELVRFGRTLQLDFRDGVAK